MGLSTYIDNKGYKEENEMENLAQNYCGSI